MCVCGMCPCAPVCGNSCEGMRRHMSTRLGRSELVIRNQSCLFFHHIHGGGSPSQGRGPGASLPFESDYTQASAPTQHLSVFLWMQPLVILPGWSRVLSHLLQPTICNNFLGQLQKEGRGRKEEERRKKGRKQRRKVKSYSRYRCHSHSATQGWVLWIRRYSSTQLTSNCTQKHLGSNLVRENKQAIQREISMLSLGLWMEKLGKLLKLWFI